MINSYGQFVLLIIGILFGLWNIFGIPAFLANFDRVLKIRTWHKLIIFSFLHGILVGLVMVLVCIVAHIVNFFDSKLNKLTRWIFS